MVSLTSPATCACCGDAEPAPGRTMCRGCVEADCPMWSHCDRCHSVPRPTPLLAVPPRNPMDGFGPAYPGADRG